MTQPPARFSPTVILIGICSLVYFLDGLIHSILGPLAPEMARDLGLGNAQLGPIFSANLIGQCIGLVTLPLLAGRMGHHRVVLLSLVGIGISQSATALMDGAAALFWIRLVTGVFLGGCLPSCLAIVTGAAPPERRGFAIMVLFTGYGLGATVAGLLASAFMQAGGWRAAMVAAGTACLATGVLARRHLSAPASAGQGPEHPARDSAPPPRAWEIVAPHYLAGTLMLWVLFISMLTISYCLNSWLPTLLVEVGRDERFAAISVSVFSLGGIVSALGIGALIDRFGAVRTLVLALSISSVLLYITGQALESASPMVMMTLLGACGFFVLGAYGGVNVILATYYPAALRATGIGWAKTVGRAGTLLAPIMIGTALTAGMRETTVMSLFAIPAMVAVLSLLVIGFCTRQPRG
jgi:AAHS family 4-hydroxybenzoate transporter-like MFS transporter